MASAKKGAAKPSKRKAEKPKQLKGEAWIKARHEQHKAVREEIDKRIGATKAVKNNTKIDDGLNVVKDGTVGRPPIEYTEELRERLGEAILSGISLDKISRMENMPHRATLLRWVANDKHPFSQDYNNWKAMLVPFFAEMVLDTATDPLIGKVRTKRNMVDRDGDPYDQVETRTFDNVERSKLKVSAYQWVLAGLAPKKYGRLATLEQGSKNEQLEALFSALKQGPTE